METKETSVKQLAEDPTYTKHDAQIMQLWKTKQIHSKVTDLVIDGPKFEFMDGPPFVSSGSLHFGHIMISAIKSAVYKFETMHGKLVANKLGFDCHGLPIEMVANKLLDIKTKKDVEKLTVDKYNAKCKELIKSYSGAWEPIYDRIGRWLDYKNSYKTMDTNYMESVWWAFGQLYKKKLVYKSYRIMPYSTKCASSLSNFEAGQCYKDVSTKSVYVLFKLKSNDKINFVAWTTTPWTLTSNLALCVNPTAEYIQVLDNTGNSYIVSKDCVGNMKLDIKETKSLGPGKQLVGLEYVPLFHYFNKDSYKVIAGDFVEGSGTVGTGIVHIAPAFGEEDYKVCIENKLVDAKTIGEVCPIDDDGIFTDIVSDFKGRYIFDTTDDIIKNLKLRGLHFRTDSHTHSYPYCYRTDTPLIYKAVSSHFIEVTAIKDQLLETHKKTNWYPENIGTGRVQKWLESVKDWGISRPRYFGTPIPLWVSDDGEEEICIESIDQLMELADLKERPTDLHREFIDVIQIPSKKGKGMLKRHPDVFDCWFESGCVPMAQHHYPFENKHMFDDKDYLSDFIVEGLDQTRGWFYTLHVLSTAIFGKPAFKHVMCTGLILDEFGNKFSKQHGNFKDPMEILNKYGADVMRLYLINSPVINANPLFFKESKIEKLKQQLIPCINGVKFFINQCTDYMKKGNTLDVKSYISSTNLMDQWIISRLGSMLKNIENNMVSYQLDKSVQELIDVIDDITNWYIKFNRDRRLKGLAGLTEWNCSLSTLYQVITNYILMAAPFMPFLTEHIYQSIKDLELGQPDSIFMKRYPTEKVLPINIAVETKMKRLQQVVKIIRFLRDSSTDFTSVKVPISKVIISHNNESYIEDIKSVESLIQDEVNCLNFEYKKLTDSVIYKLVPNNKSLGVKYKKNATYIKNNLCKVDEKDIIAFANKEINHVSIYEGSVCYQLTSEEVSTEVIPLELKSDEKIKSKIDGEIMVSIDTLYDDDIHVAYQLRLLMSHIQNMRKKSELNPWDKINIYLNTDKDSLLRLFESNIKKLSDKLKSIVVVGKYMGLNDVYISDTFSWSDFTDNTFEINVSIYKL
jgi:isoleucyl-tRNA synthetase